MNNLILVGMPCSGKTTVGKILADRMNAIFFDTDQYIIEKYCKSIEEIFEHDGEEYFRELERTIILENISMFTNHVISTGGGMPIRLNNIELLKKYGTVVYLKNSVENLKKRLDIKNRPLLKGEEAAKNLENLLKARNTIYEKADIIIECEDNSPEQVSNKVLMSINSINTHF